MPHHSTLWPASALLLGASVGLTGCSGDDPGAENGDSGSSSVGYCAGKTAALVGGSGVPKNPATPLSETPIAGSSCNAVEREFYIDSFSHTGEPCVEIEYSTNPPCFGMHYPPPFWANYRVYDEPIPRGFWVHSLEHGAVALLHSCADCDDEIAAASTLIDEIGVDPVCLTAGQPTSRLLMTPDPRLETAWAAASWGFTLTADCFEAELFRSFVVAHRGNGLESVCGGPTPDPG